MKKITLVLAVLFFTVSSLHAVQLKWNMEKGKNLEIVKTAKVKYYTNANLKRIYEERNIIDLTCTEKSDNFSRVHGVFTVYEKDYGESLFNQKNQYLVDFLIGQNGKFLVKKGDYMPNLRNIPSFPENDVKPGDSWKKPGELIIKSFSRPFKLSFPVEYTFVKIVKDKGLDIAVIHYNYMINMNMQGKRVPRDFPIRITGKNKGILYWDIKNNRPKDFQDFYKVVFVFLNGRRTPSTAEFHMNIKTENTEYANYTPEAKEKAKEELSKVVPKGMDVDLDKRGLVVRMGDLLFDFDSSRIKRDVRGKLDKIIDIIKKKYPDREIIVEGHTDNVGERRYNYNLSKRRAKSVSSYLKSKLGHDKLSYRGYGPDKPLVDNTTEKNRAKNRRVEIIIKLN